LVVIVALGLGSSSDFGSVPELSIVNMDFTLSFNIDVVVDGVVPLSNRVLPVKCLL
jgi:hypothetical protein